MFFPTVKIHITVSWCVTQAQQQRYFHYLQLHGQCVFPCVHVCGTGLHSLIILRTQTYILYLVEGCISENKVSSPDKKQTSSPLPISRPYVTALSRCISVAGWNICFCCSKNCLFVLPITPRCFSFYFSNLLASHYPVSGPSRFWIFQKLNTTICWKQVYTRGYSRVTFDISEEEAHNLSITLLEQHAFIAQVSQCWAVWIICQSQGG